MYFTLDQNTTMLAVLLLLGLSILTVEYCRRDRTRTPESEDAFLFSGKTQIHSLASNVGAFFSLTYFFGGALAYGRVFGAWYLLTAVSMFALLVLVVLLMLERMAISNSMPEAIGRSNVLLDYMRSVIGRAEFAAVLRMYSVIYFLLLAVELSVGRLVVSVLLPSHPAIPIFALSVICFVVYAYLAFGGFRAVLNSDLVQMIVIGGFVACLIFLIMKSGTPLRDSIVSSMALEPSSASLVFTLVLGLAWVAAGVDFFSRLNFTPTKGRSLLSQRKAFAVISLALTFLVLLIGILYGIKLRAEIPEIDSPITFTTHTIEHFLGIERPWVPIFFIASIFCMIFTTVDTLMLTLLQLGRYWNIRALRRKGLAQLLLLAAAISLFISAEAVSVVAVFVGSLMLAPAVGVLKAFAQRISFLAPAHLGALEWAMVAATVVFAFVFNDLKLNFDRHFLIPGLVLAVITASSVLSHAVAWIGAKR